MKQVDICSGCCQTCYQGILKHVAAAAGIFSNDDPGFVVFSVIPSQKTSYFIGVLLHSEITLASPRNPSVPKYFPILLPQFSSILFQICFSVFTVYGGAVEYACALLSSPRELGVSGLLYFGVGKMTRGERKDSR